MIIECKKIPKNYKPIKGNELAIMNHLLKYDYYDSYSIDGNRINKLTRTISFDLEKDGMNESFVNDEPVFFKCENNGKIKINYGEPKPKKCIGVIFDVFNVDVIEILQAKNFKGLRRDSLFSKGDEWELKTKTDTFKVDCGDLVVIDDDGKIIDRLKHGKNSINICLTDEYRIKKEGL